MSDSCRLCGSSQVASLVDVGPQPIANRFLTTPNDPEERYPIALCQCESCGLIQIETPVPSQALVPPYDWVTYSEPEGHLDGLVDVLLSLPGIESGSVAGGVSFKDDTTLARLERKGLRRWRLDLRDDLGVEDAHAGYGVETIQDRLTPQVADAITERHERADVLLVRHILEHSRVPRDFVEALRRLTKPSGYVVIEVPDCSRAIDVGDYTTLWEEHTLYFTPQTFGTGIGLAGLSVVRMENYPYPFENSLVAIATPNGGGRGVQPGAATVAAERDRGNAFGRAFATRSAQIRRHLEKYTRGGGRIALFGAGHLACTFVSVFGVEGFIDCVIDDNPHKRGLYMPGSHLPIVGSSVLLDGDITLCLLSLNPIGEEKVIRNNTAFLERGGVFASIFPASARALKL